MEELKLKIEGLLAPYDEIKTLECDGFCRVASRVLRDAGIEHEIRKGYVETPRGAVDPHYWIVADVWHVDYRLQMWSGDAAPHGVFRPSSDAQNPLYAHYVADDVVELACNDLIFEVLTGRKPMSKTFEYVVKAERSPDQVYTGFAPMSFDAEVVAIATFEGERALYSANPDKVREAQEEICRYYQDGYGRDPESVVFYRRFASYGGRS